MLSLDMIAEVFAEEEAWVVGGAIRDDLLGRPALDIDVACLQPERAARALAARAGEAIFPLNQEFGAWRVLLDRTRTIDFAPLAGSSIEADLAGRDFTANAIALPVVGGDYLDPYDGRADIERRALRAVSGSVFDDDPLRLLRGVRFEDELGFRLDPDAEELDAREGRAGHACRGRADPRRAAAPERRRYRAPPASSDCSSRSAVTSIRGCGRSTRRGSGWR